MEFISYQVGDNVLVWLPLRKFRDNKALWEDGKGNVILFYWYSL